MKRILELGKEEEKPQTLKVQAKDLATLWLSLPMLPPLLLWETLRLLLNLLERMPIDRTLYRELISTRINIWISVIKAKCEEDSKLDYDEIWSSIIANDGSVQHLKCLTEDEKDVYKTSMEIDQRWLIEHAADRQVFIDQAQSLNLFFRPDVNIKYLHAVHYLAWKQGLKTLYYCRSEKLGKADNGTYRTVVTLLDSQDLVGGDTIYCKKYKRRPRKNNHIAKRHRSELDKPPYGKGIIQSVARIKDGQSVVYGKDVRHGVTEVEQGQRIVFVTWFLDEKSKVKPLSSD
jgi:hypothetical protein